MTAPAKTETLTRSATRVYARKYGELTVTATPAGWTLRGVSSVWAHKTGYVVFEATIERCPCDPEHPDAATYRRLRKPPCTCAREDGSVHHERYCHGWHLPRVERLAEDVARTYGKGLA